MMDKTKFFTHKLADAAYLEGICKKTCIELVRDPNCSSRVLFIFDLTPEEGQKLVLGFGSSESFQYDASAKNLKGRLFSFTRSAK